MNSLQLFVWRELHRFTGLAQDLDFPPGYDKALIYALAVEMFGNYPAASRKYNFDELFAEAEDAVKDLDTLMMSNAGAVEPAI